MFKGILLSLFTEFTSAFPYSTNIWINLRSCVVSQAICSGVDELVLSISSTEFPYEHLLRTRSCKIILFFSISS